MRAGLRVTELGGGEPVDYSDGCPNQQSAMVLDENEWRLMANICADHLRNYKVTIAERELCERVLMASSTDGTTCPLCGEHWSATFTLTEHLRRYCKPKVDLRA